MHLNFTLRTVLGWGRIRESPPESCPWPTFKVLSFGEGFDYRSRKNFLTKPNPPNVQLIKRPKQKQIFAWPTLPMFKWSNEQKQRQISPTHRRLSVQGQLGAGYTWLIRSVPERDLVGWIKDDESRLKSIYILSKSYWGSEIICQQCFHFEIKIEQRVNLSICIVTDSTNCLLSHRSSLMIVVQFFGLLILKLWFIAFIV